MRGDDRHEEMIFSYLSPEARVSQDHPLRTIRTVVDAVLRDLSAEFDALYAQVGRPSIPPEQLLRALLLQVLYTIRSERLLMEQLDYNLLFRWFVGLNMDESVWDATTFSKNRQRLLDGQIAQAFFTRVVAAAAKSGRTGRHQTTRAIPPWTFAASRAVTQRTNRPPTPRRGCTAKGRAARPSSTTWATC